MFKKGKWIFDPATAPDGYTDFFDSFEYGTGRCMLRISADSSYCCYINGKLVAFGQYADYPHYKIGDEIDISEYLSVGTNKMYINLWYYGVDSSTYIKAQAGVVYEIEGESGMLAYSSERVLCRPSPDYVSGERIMISPQLGLTYHYDNRAYDGCREWKSIPDGCHPASEADIKTDKILPGPIKKLVLCDRVKSSVLYGGEFKYIDTQALPSERMQNAFISHTPTEGGVIKARYGEGVYIVVDLGAETVGFLDIDIEVGEACTVDIGYGEHLSDGRVRTRIGVRNFACTLEARAGRNEYMNPHRRFGCRYLQMFVRSKYVKVNYLGIRPTVYPLKIKKYECGNVLRERIYKTCQNTLICCMHEHYEDCPWREQALYTLDSRNQMLCGYYAFGEYEFARSCLKLISKGVRGDGLLSLCFPAGCDLPIPSFSLIYFVQMREYAEYSGDLSLARECFPILGGLIDTFTKNMENGLLNAFGGEGIWNFYEWSPTLDGHGERSTAPEAPLNCFFILALENMAEICRMLGRDGDHYKELARDVRKNMKKAFFIEEKGLFATFTDRYKDKISVLNNALCLLTGCFDGENKENVLSLLTSDKTKYGEDIIPNTLSMNCFRFDALIREDREKYKDVILGEIDETYLKMLCCGATSFWETESGESDFSGAGSLCHGWSALPIYYYEILT